MDARKLPDLDLLHKLLVYEPETGRLLWRPRPLEMFSSPAVHGTWNTRWAGKHVGSQNGKDVCFMFHGRWLKAHRVAWYMHYGHEPEGSIDHINGNPKDNRISNLRVVSHQENIRNLPVRSNNRSGVLGVSWDATKGKWYASIRAEGKTLSLGRYDTLEKAKAARKQADLKYGYHPNHGRVTT